MQQIMKILCYAGNFKVLNQIAYHPGNLELSCLSSSRRSPQILHTSPTRSYELHQMIFWPRSSQAQIYLPQYKESILNEYKTRGM